MVIRQILAASVLGVSCFGAWALAGPLDPESNTDGFSPAVGIDDANEARRRDLIAHQLDLNLQMIWASGCGPQIGDPFEPWLSVPGDIWGYARPRPIEQPIGHESAQTGPNRWIYRPLYPRPAEPVAPGQVNPTNPNAIGPELPGPSDPEPLAKPPAVRVPKKRPAGPREF
jgi:hypothetical protein